MQVSRPLPLNAMLHCSRFRSCSRQTVAATELQVRTLQSPPFHGSDSYKQGNNWMQNNAIATIGRSGVETLWCLPLISAFRRLGTGYNLPCHFTFHNFLLFLMRQTHCLSVSAHVVVIKIFLRAYVLYSTLVLPHCFT